MKNILKLLLSLLFLIPNFTEILGASKPTKEWWKDTFIYQIYPRSFMDSDGDGIGDLNGISSKLDYFVDLNVSAIWLSSIYVSPMEDFGYDVSNFTDIDPIFGTLNDFKNLTLKAKSMGLKIIIDFIPNHTSEKHPWFINSINKIKPYDDYYIWMDGVLINGTTYPPNNWLSVYGGSAWKFNKQRGQYYLHQFSSNQPDLNYRNIHLNTEINGILTFWLDNGVDGFHFDSINYLIEDIRYLDEPKIYRPDLSIYDYDTLDHIYTKNQNETYGLLKNWRKLLDAHSKKDKDTKIILTGADANLELTMLYYDSGSNIPINYMFVKNIDNSSTIMDYKRYIDNWLNNVPKMHSPNWFSGNHNYHRVSKRFGNKRADEISMISAILPGTGIIYYGDEIGMEDRKMTFNETVDPIGCSAGSSKYYLKSRDPQRTPFQWNNSTSAGFSINNKTWLPINNNYKRINLDLQKNDLWSHYSLFKKLIKLKKTVFLDTATTEVILIGYDAIGIVRRLPNVEPVVLLINFTNRTVVIDARTWMNIPEQLTVFASSVGSKIPSGVTMDTTEINLPSSASVILTA